MSTGLESCHAKDDLQKASKGAGRGGAGSWSSAQRGRNTMKLKLLLLKCTSHT